MDRLGKMLFGVCRDAPDLWLFRASGKSGFTSGILGYFRNIGTPIFRDTYT